MLQSKGLIRRAVSGEANLANTAGLVAAMRLPAPVTDYLVAFRDNLASLWRSISGPRSDDGDDETDRLVTTFKATSSSRLRTTAAASSRCNLKPAHLMPQRWW